MAPIEPRAAASPPSTFGEGDGGSRRTLTCSDAHDGVGAAVAPRAGARALDGDRPRARVAPEERRPAHVHAGRARARRCSCWSASTASSTSSSAGEVVLDPSRVAAQIVSGIGFIGGGLIFVRRDSVRGLTTAAGVWLVAAVGMAAGGWARGAGDRLDARLPARHHHLSAAGATAAALGRSRRRRCASPTTTAGACCARRSRGSRARASTSPTCSFDRDEHDRVTVAVEVRGREPLTGPGDRAGRARRRACSVHAADANADPD